MHQPVHTVLLEKEQQKKHCFWSVIYQVLPLLRNWFFRPSCHCRGSCHLLQKCSKNSLPFRRLFSNCSRIFKGATSAVDMKRASLSLPGMIHWDSTTDSFQLVITLRLVFLRFPSFLIPPSTSTCDDNDDRGGDANILATVRDSIYLLVSEAGHCWPTDTWLGIWWGSGTSPALPASNDPGTSAAAWTR